MPSGPWAVWLQREQHAQQGGLVCRWPKRLLPHCVLQKEGEFTLHTRAILEMEQHIRETYPDAVKICNICHGLLIQVPLWGSPPGARLLRSEGTSPSSVGPGPWHCRHLRCEQAGLSSEVSGAALCWSQGSCRISSRRLSGRPHSCHLSSCVGTVLRCHCWFYTVDFVGLPRR